jgi:hypothetical protein
MKQIILLAFFATVLIAAIARLRAYRLKERHVLLIIFLGMPFLVLAMWPEAIGWLAAKMGIEYHTVSLLCLTGFLILMIFELFTIVSLQERRIATLAQIVGIMMEKQGISDRELKKALEE